MEKMKQILSTISIRLTPFHRTDVMTDPMAPDEVLSFELNRGALDERVDKMLSPSADLIKKDDLPPFLESTNQLSERRTKREWNCFH